MTKTNFKYLCPFGDDHKFKTLNDFANHLVHVHHAIVDVTNETFVLVPTKDYVYKISDYEVKVETSPIAQRIIDTEK